MFFLFDDAELRNNRIFLDAFEHTMFSKLRSEGYCDINPLLGKPRITKAEIENNLRKLNSPITKLYSNRYAKNTEEFREFLMPYLNDMKCGYHELNEYEYFSIVYFFFQTLESYETKWKFAKKYYNIGNEDNSNDSTNITNGIVYDKDRVHIEFVSSLSEYYRFLSRNRDESKKLFFRGQSNISYKLIPSIFRNKKWLENEKRMYLEVKSRCPEEFESQKTHVGQLAKMQHYSLPTRLLDITWNPLVALFFACNSETSSRGEVIIFAENKNDIKYFQSDKVAVLSSLPLFTFEEQEQLYNLSLGKTETDSFFAKETERLVHEVKTERPGFISKIRPDDLRGVAFCMPEQNNRRIENQEGAFLVCGLLDNIYGREESNPISEKRIRNSDNKTVVCIIDNKDRILKDLNTIGFNESHLFPDIEKTAEYIKNHIEEI